MKNEQLGSIIDCQLFYIETLYFKLLQTLLTAEVKRAKSPSPIDCVRSLLEKDTFHGSLFACCVEIVLFLYNSKRLTDCLFLTFKKQLNLILLGLNKLADRIILHRNGPIMQSDMM